MTGTRLGSFEIIEEIGRGGMGVVYRARQLSLDRVVAVKVLPPEYVRDGTAAERFAREAHAMARLSHPNIVDVIEVGEQDGTHYFAMQFIEGPDLREVILERGSLGPERSAELAAQVADALAHAHDQGIVHRDIKPDNILLDPNGRAVVTDFGIAKAANGSQLTQTGTAIGAPEYMSPEVLRGNPLDGRADLYSLGVVLFQMVTGRVPFVATTPFEVANQHLTQPPPRPTAIGTHCPEWLEAIILRALAKEPADRFGSAREMALALRASAPMAGLTQEFVPGRRATVPPQPPGAWSPASGWAPGTHAAVWALAAVGVCLIVLAAVLLAGTRSSGRGAIPDGITGGLTGGAESGAAGGASVQVPSVAGVSWAEAEERLGRLGLQALRVGEYSDTVSEGNVIRQHPGTGMRAPPGATVDVVVSTGVDFPLRVGQIAMYRDRDGDPLNVRDRPWGAVVDRLPYGARIEVLEIDPQVDPGWIRGRRLPSGTAGWMAVCNPNDKHQLLYPAQ